MSEDNKFKVKTVEVNDGGTYGKFVCEPLDRGYGITLGCLLYTSPSPRD